MLTLVNAQSDPVGPSMYFSGDTVWYDGIAEISRRFPVDYAVLNMGAARVLARAPDHLTMTADDGVAAARAFGRAAVVPLHYEGWAHFTEGRDVIARTFEEAGLDGRVRWLESGVAQPLR